MPSQSLRNGYFGKNNTLVFIAHHHVIRYGMSLRWFGSAVSCQPLPTARLLVGGGSVRSRESLDAEQEVPSNSQNTGVLPAPFSHECRAEHPVGCWKER